MMVRLILIFSALCMMSSCLKTRADLAEEDQSQVYGKKSGDNQMATARPSQLSTKAQPAVVDDRDETIRAFNGRIESLENQINNLQKEKEKAAAASTTEAQKNQALQESLAKMEAQIQKLEAEAAGQKAAAAVASSHTVTGSDANTIKASGAAPAAKGDKSKKEVAASDYDLAQGHFAKKEWKKAILVYQKYVDESPKGSNVADAKYKIGVCFQELGMKEEAMAFYEEVIANFGKTESGKKAKLRLAKLKK